MPQLARTLPRIRVLTGSGRTFHLPLLCFIWLASLIGLARGIDFAQITDPHIFDGKTERVENSTGLRWCIEQINEKKAGRNIQFVVVTGDLGLEGLNMDGKDRAAVIDEAATEFAKFLQPSQIETWLFVPGNNDLVKEDPATINLYDDFIRRLSIHADGKRILDLCSTSPSYLLDGCAFLGFNNASFKGNGLAADAQNFENAQLTEIDRLKANLAGPAVKHAFVFYHIPELDDPYFSIAPEEVISERKKEQTALEYNNPKSAWTVTNKVRTAWGQTLSDSKLAARFAGHFHSSLRSHYEQLYITSGSSPLRVCPPIAIKRQEKASRQARGFRLVTVNCTSGECDSEIIWYESAAAPSAPVAPPNCPSTVNPPSRCEHHGFWFIVGFLSLLLFVGFCIFSIWYWFLRKITDRPGENYRATANIFLFFIGAIILGFAVLASLAVSADIELSFRVVSVGTLWALAALASGGGMGFLFGIPRTGNPPAETQAGDTPTDSTSNAQRVAPAKTNLEEIADWLSKLIVGGTIFQSGNIASWLRDAGSEFATTVSLNANEWRGVGTASLVYFGLIGFFGGHFLTRLYLVGVLRRADEGEKPVVGELTGLTRTQLDALESAPLSLEEAGREFDTIAEEAAKEIMKLKLDNLLNWRDIRLWSKAHLSLGCSQEAEEKVRKEAIEKAISGYHKAIQMVPNDAETRLGYALALSRKNASTGAVLLQLERAHGSLMLDTLPELCKNVYKSLIYKCLYLKPPESFVQALKYGKEYFARKDVPPSAGIFVNIACAYGQYFRWLSGNPDPASNAGLPVPAVFEGPTNTEVADRKSLLEWIAKQALAAMREALSRDPSNRAKFRHLMGIDPIQTSKDAGSDPKFELGKEDQDLECFAGRPEFANLVQ